MRKRLLLEYILSAGLVRMERRRVASAVMTEGRAGSFSRACFFLRAGVGVMVRKGLGWSGCCEGMLPCCLAELSEEEVDLILSRHKQMLRERA